MTNNYEEAKQRAKNYIQNYNKNYSVLDLLSYVLLQEDKKLSDKEKEIEELKKEIKPCAKICKSLELFKQENEQLKAQVKKIKSKKIIKIRYEKNKFYVENEQIKGFYVHYFREY